MSTLKILKAASMRSILLSKFVSASTATSVSLSWVASTDNVGVSGYVVYVDGAAVSSVTQPGATISGLTCGAAHTFAVDAYDAAGNHSAPAELTAATAACPDTQLPTAPTNVTTTVRTATSIALSWSASSDNVGVVGYGLYKAGAAAGTSAGTTGIFPGLTCNTNYTLAIDAYDAAGNRSQKTTVMVATTACPDTAPPSTPAGLAASSVTQTSLTLTWSAASDNVAVTGYDVYRNNTKMATVTSTSSIQSGLGCGTSYSFAVVAKDAAGNSSQQVQLNASTSACSAPPSPPPPPPAGLGVDRATMLATGGTILREDTSAVADPEAALWGNIEAAADSRHAHIATGADTRPKADGSAQGNTAYRRMTVIDGDEVSYGSARAELGRNERRNGENTGTRTDGTFALFGEGEHKIVFWSMRFPTGFDFAQGSWQTILQVKQAQPYAANGPVNGAPALEINGRSGQILLSNHWNVIWTTSAPPLNTWIRFALDIVWSKDPTKGKLQMYVDRDGDGDFLDATEMSPLLPVATLAYASTAGSGLSVGDPIPGHLRLGLYHNPVIPGSSVEIDNVQVVGG